LDGGVRSHVFGEGTHGWGCHTQTVPMRCRDCRERIYFFRCSHGSRILFDKLGPPWPQHDCERRWVETRRRTVDEHGRVHVEIAPGITATQLPDDFDIEDEIVDLAHRTPSRTRRRPDDIDRMDPTPSADDFYGGTLREITPKVDPVRHFGVPNNAVALAGLRDLGRYEVGRITVHVPFGDAIESYSAWVPAVLLDDDDVVRGATIEVRLVGLRILGPEPTVVWHCPSFEMLFA
jgi:hypothetical protein